PSRCHYPTRLSFPTRRSSDLTETLSIPLPAVVAVSTDINSPQIPSMKAILGAAKKPVQVWSAADIGFNAEAAWSEQQVAAPKQRDRKSTRLNSSHVSISYAVF